MVMMRQCTAVKTLLASVSNDENGFPRSQVHMEKPVTFVIVRGQSQGVLAVAGMPFSSGLVPQPNHVPTADSVIFIPA